MISHGVVSRSLSHTLCLGSSSSSSQPVFFVAIAFVLLYWLYLTIVQLLSGPRRDLKSSLPVPPRALTGNGAWPILGHTILFHKHGQNIAYLFPPEWREWFFIPWSQKLGHMYSVFVWGQWNVVVKGKEQVEKLILEGDLTEGWPYKSPPTTLLGKTCLALLDGDEATCLRSMITRPLCHESVLKHAPRFAELAEQCIDDVLAGRFHKGDNKSTPAPVRPTSAAAPPPVASSSSSLPKQQQQQQQDSSENDSDHMYDDLLNTSDSDSSDDGGEKTHKVMLNALRSYTLNLMHGPVLNLDRHDRDYMSTTTSHRKMSQNSSSGIDDWCENKTVRFQDSSEEEMDESEMALPSQEMLLLWMERLKKGLCHMKITYGANWMQLWRCTWYGRALHARKKLEGMLSAHVEEREKRIPVHHEKGRATRDPFASAIPLWSFTELCFSRMEHPVMGFRNMSNMSQFRNRTRSENDVLPEMADVHTYSEAKIVVRPRNRAQSEPDMLVVESTKPAIKSNNNKRKPVVDSVLDQILREADHEGRGITRVATTEITLLIWMMMDAGQAWTSMALHLLSKHEDACDSVQAEIDHLAHKYADRLFTPFVLSKMEKLDNLIYEAIRFCPAFMGGVKMTNATVEFDEVQVPKHTTVLLSNLVDEESFTIHYDPPKQPQEMGKFYPSVDLYGFLPLQGLEIPIMILQTKIFLIVLLQKHTLASAGKRQTLMRRISEKITVSLRNIRSPHRPSSIMDQNRSRSVDDLCTLERGLQVEPKEGSVGASVSAPSTPPRPASSMSPPRTLRTSLTPPADPIHIEIRQEERLFTRVPFPEPRRPVRIVPRMGKVLFPPTTTAATCAKPGGMVSRGVTQ